VVAAVTTLTVISATRTWQRSWHASATETAVLPLCLGNAVQWYDFALYGAFATIIGPVFFPAEDPSTVLLAAFAVYGTALIIRPVGAVIFGRMADLRGRRAVFVPIIVLMAGATAAVGFLPGYAVIGVLAPVTLLLLRATQGLAAGGELGVAGVLIFERAPSRQRGQFSSWHTATLALGLGVGMAVAAVLLVAQRSHPLEVGWWRLAFILALPLGLVAKFVRRRVSETSQFLAVQQSGHVIKHPIPTMWANDRLAVLRGFALIAAGSLAFNTFFIFMPNHLAATRKLDLVATLSITAATLAVTAVAAWALGRLSDAVGRRPVAIWSAFGLAVLAGPMAVLASASQLGLLIGQLIMGAVLAGVLLVAMIGELFPAPLRSTGMSITAGLATALVGGTAPVVDQILVTVSRFDVAPGLYVSLVACLALVALRRWPETAFRPTV
jgi:MFS transporter, MHS family, proline/betaine transporter